MLPAFSLPHPQALHHFYTMGQADHRSCNLIISGLIRCRRLGDALYHFLRMTRGPLQPDNFTYSIIIPCCDLYTGRQIHARVIKACPDSDPFVATNLVRMYADAGQLGDGRRVFEEMPHKDTTSWNVIISSYSKFRMGNLCLQLFQRMVRHGMRSDDFTFATVLNELANGSQVFPGMQLHSSIIKYGFGSDRFTCNALLNLYSKCGFVSSAARLFDGMAERDVVSWTAMISGFVVSGRETDAFEAFRWMRMSQVDPNSFTFGSLVSSCTNANSIEMGMQCHGLVLKYGLDADVVVGSAVTDMYSKCGEMDDALRLFRSLPDKDLVSWNVMICGLAQNGEANKALQLFDEMVGSDQTRVRPDSVTFIGVLTACSHGGLVDKGCEFFRDMVHKYSIEPLLEHYACIVDCLARAGRFDEAETVILGLPFKPDAVILGALLGACRRKGNLVMAKHIAERLMTTEPTNSSNYVLLANMYTDRGEWNTALGVREDMCTNGSHKEAGCSWIEMRGRVYSFVSGRTHIPQHEPIFEILQNLRLLMLEKKYDLFS